MINKNKKAFEMSFVWLFSLIVGAFILFLAIYFAISLAGQQQYKLDTTTAKDLSILLNPMQSGEGIIGISQIGLASQTKINNYCDIDGNFGTQIISVSQKTGFTKDWPEGAEISFENKYIFSNESAIGKKFYVFSPGFDYPFHIASLIILISSSDQYYFSNVPDKIKSEISSLQSGGGLDNIYFADYPPESIKVCFGGLGSQCDVKVTGTCSSCYDQYDEGIVEKDGRRVKYVTRSLMYAAIFSEPGLYECQLKRLMKRAQQLALVYREQGQLISVKKCNTNNMDLDLLQFSNAAKNFNNEFGALNVFRDNLKDKNDENGICKLW